MITFSNMIGRLTSGFFVRRMFPFVGVQAPSVIPFILQNKPLVGSRDSRGFSLIELVITLTIAAILLSTGVPSLIKFVRSNRLITVTNDLVSDFSLARAEALKRGTRVGVCKSSGGSACATTGDWNNGWIVFADLDSSGAWTASDVVLLKRDAVPSETAITASATAVIYSSQGITSSGSGAYTICNTSLHQTRTITIDATGRHRLSTGSC